MPAFISYFPFLPPLTSPSPFRWREREGRDGSCHCRFSPMVSLYLCTVVPSIWNNSTTAGQQHHQLPGSYQVRVGRRALD